MLPALVCCLPQTTLRGDQAVSNIAFDNPFAHIPNAQTRLLGVIGHPVAHSLSPALHNPALAWLGLNMRYLAFHVYPERLPEAVRGFVAMGMRGFNATVPHKEALLPLMDWLDPLAERIGAVNTVAIDPDGLLRGYNTDAQGFTDALAETEGWRSSTEWGDRSVLVLGAGGAARGVVVGLLEAGIRTLTVANRTLARAEQLLADLAPHYPQATLRAVPQEPLPLEGVDLLVNTTLLGLAGEEMQMVEMDRLPDTALIYDIVYAPRETPLLRAAKRRGLAVQNGLGMLIHQGRRGFKIWTGEEMPVERVRARLLGLL
ncbi:MAG: shikimate dehydrogenase [Magnetococcales bacterium]|nr:shikimate dehydrogenase [Magnetococcales bacterium]